MRVGGIGGAHRIAERIATDVADGPEAEGEMMLGEWSVGDQQTWDGRGLDRGFRSIRSHRGSVHRWAARLARIERRKSAKISRGGRLGSEARGRTRADAHGSYAVGIGRCENVLEVRERGVAPPHAPRAPGSRGRSSTSRKRALSIARLAATATCDASSGRCRLPRVVVVDELVPQRASRFRALRPADVVEPEQQRVRCLRRGRRSGRAAAATYCATALLPVGVRSNPMPSVVGTMVVGRASSPARARRTHGAGP